MTSDEFYESLYQRFDTEKEVWLLVCGINERTAAWQETPWPLIPIVYGKPNTDLESGSGEVGADG